MPSIFLSHSWGDKPFVRNLADRLTQEGIVVWLDEAQLNIGDSLIRKISEGIEQMEYVAAIISTKSIKSNWVQKELCLAMTKEIKGKKVVVLPLLVEPCELPDFLKDKVYADFTKTENYERGFLKLLKAMGIQKVTSVSHEKPEQQLNTNQESPVAKSLADAFEDMRIVGVDKSRTNRPDPSSLLYHVYFELSDEPPSDWDTIFQDERSFSRHTMWREAWVEGQYIVVNCCLDEVQKFHLNDIKQNVENTNRRYREALRKYEAELERERKQKEDEEKKKSGALDDLKFD